MQFNTMRCAAGNAIDRFDSLLFANSLDLGPDKLATEDAVTVLGARIVGLCEQAARHVKIGTENVYVRVE